MARITFRNAADVPYDNTASGLTADDVQEALDEIVAEFVDGSGGATQVAYFSDTDTITSEAAFAYIEATDTLNVRNIQPDSNQALSFIRHDGTAWATLSAATGATVLNVSTLVKDNLDITFGTGNDLQFRWSNQQTNDGLLIATTVGSSTQSGNIIITTQANLTKDHLHAAATNPTLIVHAATDVAVDEDDYLAFWHDATDGQILTNNGNLVLGAPGGLSVLPAATGTYGLGSNIAAWARVHTREINPDTGQSLIIRRQDGTAWATLDTGTGNTAIGINSQFGDGIAVMMGATIGDSRIFWSSAQTNDALLITLGVGTAAQSGNIILTTEGNAGKDHDHGVATTPTLIIHSATDPDTDNTEWISFLHSGSQGFIATGKGDIFLDPAGNRVQPGGTTGTVSLGIASTAWSNVFTRNLEADTGQALTINRQDGTAWATTSTTTGVTIMGVATRFSDLISLQLGSSSDVLLQWSSLQSTAHSMMIGVAAGSATQGGNMILTTLPNVNKDHDHAVATDPTLILHSATDPDTANDEWLAFSHNGTAAQLETGSGVLTMTIPGGALRPNVTNAISLGLAGVAYSDVFTRTIQADTSQALLINRADGANWASVSAGGVVTISQNTVMTDDREIIFGSTTDSLIGWQTAGTNDVLVIATGVGTAAQSGNIIITTITNFAKDHDHSTHNNPTLIIHSATDPDTNNTQFVSFNHNATDAVFTVGTGDLEIDATQVRAPSGNTLVLARADGNQAIDITTTDIEIRSTMQFIDGVAISLGNGNDSLLDWSTSQVTANSVVWGVGVGSAALGGNFIFTALANVNQDHDHAVASNPTLIVHSATDPDTSNTQWISMFHDATDATIGSGGATLKIHPRAGNTSLTVHDGSTASNALTLVVRNQTNGSPKMFVLSGGAHTSLTNADLIDLHFNLARVVEFDGGAATIDRYSGLEVDAATLNAAASGLIVTDAATVYISGAPVDGGANITLTDSWALWVDDGAVRLDGGLLMNDGSVSAPALAPQSEADTGIYFTGNATEFAANGEKVFQVQKIAGTNTLFLAAFNANTVTTAIRMDFNHQPALQNDGDIITEMNFFGEDDGGATQVYGRIRAVAGNTAAGSENGRIEFYAGTPGSDAEVLRVAGTVMVVNNPGGDVDFRVAGESLARMIGTDASSATENVILLSGAVPAWNSMDRGIFLGDVTTAPTGNPTAGIYIWSESGAGKARGGSGTVTVWADAEPHCTTCGKDFALEWENDGTTVGMTEAHLAVCVWCLMAVIEANNIDLSSAIIKRSGA